MTGDTVFLLHHVYEFDDGHESVRLIGVHTSEARALAVKEALRNQAGFRDVPEGRQISEATLDDDHVGWSEGYVTLQPGEGLQSVATRVI